MAGDDISPEQAHESHQRLVDHYFGNPAERPRIHIPARPTKDDDLVVSAYIDQSTARIAALEAELAQLRSGLYSDSLTDAQVAELQRDIELDVGAWDAVGLRQALLRELQRMRCAMPDLIRRSNELPGLSAAHDEAQHELAQLRREKAAALELIADLRGYTRDWDWKYGAEWDEAERALRGNP